MQIVILASQSQKQELETGTINSDIQKIWISEPGDFLNYRDSGAFMDLMFEKTAERIALLEQLLPAVVIINSVEHTLTDIHSSFIRINGWNGFLQAALWESSASLGKQLQAHTFFAAMGKECIWLPDTAGFITPRVISMIINEAFMALDEGVSTKEEIDLAMKLGTNYPHGPFEWAAIIGKERVFSLLNVLASQNEAYHPARLLKE